MPFIFLTEQHHMKVDTLPDGPFYTIGQSRDYEYQVPHGCAPVLCGYTGDWTEESHAWKNPITGHIHTTPPLGLTPQDGSFFEGFYEITPIEGLIFGEGEAWCPDTCKKIPVKKPDQQSIWNPFFQQYDPPCDRSMYECEPNRIKYALDASTHYYFESRMEDFFEVYCRCCVCEYCHSIHEYVCREEAGV